MDQLKKENKELNEVVNKALEDMAVFHARAELETHKRIEVEKKAQLLMNKIYGKCIKQPDQNDREEQVEKELVKVKKLYGDLLQQHKHDKDNLEKEIASLRALVETGRCVTEKVLLDIKDGKAKSMDAFFPFPNSEQWITILETSSDGTFDMTTGTLCTTKEILDAHPTFSDGSSTKEYTLLVYNEIFEFEENNIGELKAQHKALMGHEQMYKDYLEWKQLKIKREKRIKFVNDHKEEIEKLKEQPTFSHVKSYYYNTTPRFRYDGYLFPYNTFSKDDLKIECKIRDLKWGGKKTDLLKRLTNPLLSTHKAKKPYHPRLMFVAWLKRAAYMEFEDEEAEYQEIGKFHRGWWEYMEAYVEYEDYYAIVVKAGQAFGAFDY